MSSSLSRFLTEDPHLRLGARGAAEVKNGCLFCDYLFQFAVNFYWKKVHCTGQAARLL